MNSSQKNKHSAYENTLAAGARYLATASPIPVITRHNATLAAKIAAINAASVKQSGGGSAGATSAKSTARTELVHATTLVASTVASYASEHADPQLLSHVDHNKSELEHLRDADLAPRVADILASAGTVLPALAEHNLVQADLDALQAKLTAYQTAQPAPRDQIVEHSVVTRDLQSLFDDTDKFLEKIYDPAVRGLTEKAPVFVKEYFAAREIIDRGGSHPSSDTPPPPPPTTPPPAPTTPPPAT